MDMKWLCIALLGLGGCRDTSALLPTDTGPPQEKPQLAKPQPVPGTGPISETILDFTATSEPTHLRSDGRGAYTNGVCGVNASTAGDAANELAVSLWPAASTPAASCGGARSATVRMLVRHLGDDPHVDDDTTPVGDLVLGNMAVGVNGVAKINAPTLACFHSSRGGRSMSGIGMRFNTAVYPGSNYLNVTVNGDRLWHIETAPYPNNIGYCEGDLGVSYWHMNLSIDITPAD
jgi:hypothetical protein